MADSILIANKWEIQRRLGKGGMGAVYEVVNKLGKRMAVKQLHADLELEKSIFDRFYREAQVMVELKHKHIVEVIDIDSQEGFGAYILMELVRGTDLGRIIREKGSLEYPEVLRIGSEVAQALDYAHRRHVIHRDIKPANILIEDDTARAVVTDFGIAKKLGDSGQTNVTGATKEFIGTYRYCAPEQFRNARDVDARVDIYSLGCVLYEMFRGKPILWEMDGIEVASRMAYSDMKLDLDFDVAPPTEFMELLAACLEKDRNTRVQTARALHERLEECRHVHLQRSMQRAIAAPPAPEAAPASEPPIEDSVVPIAAAPATAGAVSVQTRLEDEYAEAPTVPLEDSVAIARRKEQERLREQLAEQIRGLKRDVERRREGCEALRVELAAQNVAPDGTTLLSEVEERLRAAERLSDEGELENARANLEKLNDSVAALWSDMRGTLRGVLEGAGNDLRRDWQALAASSGPFLSPAETTGFERAMQPFTAALQSEDWDRCRNILQQSSGHLRQARDAVAQRATESIRNTAAEAERLWKEIEADAGNAGLALAPAALRPALDEALGQQLWIDAQKRADQAVEQLKALTVEVVRRRQERAAQLAALRKAEDSLRDWLEHAASAPDRIVGALCEEAETFLSGDRTVDPGRARTQADQLSTRLEAALKEATVYQAAADRQAAAQRAAQAAMAANPAPDLLTGVRTIENEAKVAFDRSEWGKARERYEEVARQYGLVEQAVARAAAQARVEEARSAADAIAEAINAAEAREVAPGDYTAAEQTIVRARQAEQRDDLVGAQREYEDARGRFEKIRERVVRARSEQLLAVERELRQLLESSGKAQSPAVFEARTAAERQLAAPRPEDFAIGYLALEKARDALAKAIETVPQFEAALAERKRFEQVRRAVTEQTAGDEPTEMGLVAREAEAAFLKFDWVKARDRYTHAIEWLEEFARNRRERAAKDRAAATASARSQLDGFLARANLAQLREAADAEVRSGEQLRTGAADAERRNEQEAARQGYEQALEAFKRAEARLVEVQAQRLTERERAVRKLLEELGGAPEAVVGAARKTAQAAISGIRGRDAISATSELERAEDRLREALTQVPLFEEAEQRREQARQARRTVDGLKAKKSQRRDADATFATAESTFGKGDWRGATASYDRAIAGYAQLIEAARAEATAPVKPAKVEVAAPAMPSARPAPVGVPAEPKPNYAMWGGIAAAGAAVVFGGGYVLFGGGGSTGTSAGSGSGAAVAPVAVIEVTNTPTPTEPIVAVVRTSTPTATPREAVPSATKPAVAPTTVRPTASATQAKPTTTSTQKRTATLSPTRKNTETPKPADTPTPRNTPTPRDTPVPQSVDTKSLVRGWLSDLETALESKNVAQLRLMLKLDASAAERLGEALRTQESLNVTIRKLDVKELGADRVTVQYERVDDFVNPANQKPKTVESRIQQTFRIAGGRVELEK